MKWLQEQLLKNFLSKKFKKRPMLDRIRATIKNKIKEILSLVFRASLYIPPVNERFICFSKVWGNISNALAKEVRQKTIVVIDQEVLKPDQNAGCLRMFEIIKILNKLGYEITFISSVDGSEARYIKKLEGFCKRVVCGFEQAAVYLESEEFQFSHVLISRPEVYKKFYFLIKITNPLSKIIYDTVDLHWVRIARMAEIENSLEQLRQSENVKSIELFAIKNSDFTLAVSCVEKNIILSEAPESNVVIVPTIHNVVEDVPGFESRNDLIFIGGFGHKPNEDAVLYFATEIMPKVLKELPRAKFKIVGSNMPQSIKNLASESIIPLGFVEDLRDLFANAKMLVAPLRYGAGVKGKITQSLSNGLPVITTELGAEGIGLVDLSNALIATNTTDFVNKIILLYENEVIWNRLSSGGLSLVNEKFSPDYAIKALNIILNRDYSNRNHYNI